MAYDKAFENVYCRNNWRQIGTNFILFISTSKAMLDIILHGVVTSDLAAILEDPREKGILYRVSPKKKTSP
jgi:hypothetical protein